MKLEVGKKYIACNNKEVRIICIDAMIDRGVVCLGLEDCGNFEYPRYYSDSGEYIVDIHSEYRKNDEFDLIRELTPFDNLPIDTKVFVWDRERKDGMRGYFAGISEHGKPMVWSFGRTSWSAESKIAKISFEYCEIFE